jgi:hypothetical protein
MTWISPKQRSGSQGADAPGEVLVMAAMLKSPFESYGTVEEVGEVLEAEAEEYVVDVGNARRRARRAVSCLVVPEVGDAVLLVGRANGPAFVVAILERPGGGQTRIGARGDLRLEVDAGRLSVAAADGIDLVSSQDIALVARGVEVRSSKVQIFFEQLGCLGKRILAEVDEAKATLGVFDSVLERLSQRVKRSYRTVEEVDQVRAEQIDYKAEKNLRVRGENALVSATKLVKVDGEQIHLG